MIWYILLAVVAVFGVIALIAATKPDDWSIQRQGTVPGTPAKVFSYIDDLHKFLEWSPLAKLDPTMKLTYDGPASGSGANFSWVGNGKAGVGKMTITESRPNDLVRCRLDFYKPFKCTNTQEFALKPEGSQTIVTWTMNGKAPFFFKLIMVFVSCDTMMGKDLERGLGNLKGVVAGTPAEAESGNQKVEMGHGYQAG
jgi:hypothetical protein